MSAWIISRDTLKHIFEEHRDLVELLNLYTLEDLRRLLLNTLRSPDETHVDRFRNDVRYFLKKIDDLWINVVVVRNSVKTAYLLGSRSYRKFAEKRWR